ncbi:MAG: BatD family protein [Chromatiales bacterium]|jgi:hypothetical protein
MTDTKQTTNPATLSKSQQTVSRLTQYLLLVALLCFSSLLQADISARLDRQQAYEGETVTLTIRAENSNSNADPDLTPLQKDFVLGGTSQSSQISIINGRRSDSRTWSVRLQPKKLGTITLPAISVGTEKTRPLTLEVKPIPEQSGAAQGQPLFVTLEVANKAKHFYVQQHIPLVARLYYKHKLNQPQLIDPAPDKALVERLGDDSNYSSKYNGQDYRVYERHYSVLAEKSGELHIPPVTFRGYMSKAQQHNGGLQRSDPFSQFFSGTPLLNQGQAVSVKSNSLDLTIESHPNEYTGQQWLPAESLTLTDSWSDNPPTFRVGEPVSRTITIEAKGLVASQIKPLELPAVSSFRRYAEPAETATHTDGLNVFANSSRTFTYIPAYAGAQEIPPVELVWWNVVEGSQQTARLPAWKITVEKGAEATRPQSQPPATAPQDSTPQTTPQPDVQANEASFLQSSMLQLYAWLKEYWYWLAAVVVVMLALLKLLASRQEQQAQSAGQPAPHDNRPVASPTAAGSGQATDKQLLEDFRSACRENDAPAAARALLALARRQWPDNPPRSLGMLASRLESGREALLELDRFLYSDSKQSWDGAEICRQFEHGMYRGKQTSSQVEPVLRPLYPDNN